MENYNTGNAIGTLITITGIVIGKITIPVMLSSIPGIVVIPITIPGMLALTYYLTGTVIKKITIPVLYSGFKYNTRNDNLRVWYTYVAQLLLGRKSK